LYRRLSAVVNPGLAKPGEQARGLIGCLGHELARLVREFGPLICDVLGYRHPLLHWPAFAGVEREARSTRDQRVGAGAGQFDDEPAPAHHCVDPPVYLQSARPEVAALSDAHARQCLGCGGPGLVRFADGGFLAGGFGQWEVRLDLVAVAAAVFLLDHVAGSGLAGDDAAGAALGDAQAGRDIAQLRARWLVMRSNARAWWSGNSSSPPLKN
jgi:hypothetical protein